MKLEQGLYETRQAEAREPTIYFTVGDLESLSASELYTSNLPPMSGGFGGGGGLPPMGGGSGNGPKFPGPKFDKPAIFDIKPIKVPTLKIRPLGIGADLHIHERDGFMTGASLKDHGAKKGIKLTGYQASIADLYADLFNKKTILK